MSILDEIKAALTTLNIPIETGVFTGEAPDTYIVVIPLSETFDLHADNSPEVDVQEARISLFAKTAYTTVSRQVVRALLSAGMTVTARRYNGFETETGYHHYTVDAADYFEFKEE